MGTSMDEIRATWASNWDMLQIIIAQVLENMKTTVEQGLFIIKFLIVDTLQSAATSARQLIAVFRQVGSDIINGLVSGIRAAAQRVVDAAKSVVQGAIEAAKSALQSQSESRVGIQIGEDFDRGLVTGLSRLAPAVQAQMQAVVQAPAMAIAGRVRGDTITQTEQNFNLTTQSVVRPGGLEMEFGAMQFQAAGASR
jgi:hypothetical protein